VATSEKSSAARVTIRTFAAGAGCGFLAGAFAVAMIVWQFGNVIGTRADSDTPGSRPRPAVERWVDGVDDAGEGIIEAARGRPEVATTGNAEVVKPSPPLEPVIGPPPGEALEGRDLLVPVEGVEPDDLVRSFSDARNGRKHEAMDILAPRNTPVKAVEGGTIARLFSSKAGGITIYQFDPSEQYCYYYAHLERYAPGLAEGGKVRKGQVIGYVGTSGNAPRNTPHLHFAIFQLTAAKRWWEGTPIDPYDVLH
jgi:murein DD-endopeptidase MepM/ murein hydrolase activator NlpD